jgi:amino acid transporter
VSAPAEPRDTGPGALETALVLALTVVIAGLLLLFGSGWLAELVAIIPAAGQGGR